MRKRTLKEKFYTGCGYSIFGALAFAFFLGLSVTYGIKTASIIVGAIVTVFWLILEPTVIQNEPVVVEQTYEEPTVPTCCKKYSCSRFKKLGRVRYGDYTYTWYSQRVLPGGGLNIPGRHLNEHGLVVDENEYVVIASDDLPHGVVVDTPVGIQGIVYDEGSGNGNLDIYCDW